MSRNQFLLLMKILNFSDNEEANLVNDSNPNYATFVVEWNICATNFVKYIISSKSWLI